MKVKIAPFDGINNKRLKPFLSHLKAYFILNLLDFPREESKVYFAVMHLEKAAFH